MIPTPKQIHFKQPKRNVGYWIIYQDMDPIGVIKKLDRDIYEIRFPKQQHTATSLAHAKCLVAELVET